jgi:hypothetical protein
MSFKTTYILFGVLIAMLGLFGLLLAFKKSGPDRGDVFPSLNDPKKPVNLSDVDSVTIERKGEKRLVLVRDKRGWHTDNPRVRLLDFKVKTLVQEVAGAKRDEEADVNSNLAQWGLDSPRAVVTLHYTPPPESHRQPEEWVLKLGRQSPEKDGVVYVTSSDRPGEVMAVKRSELAAVVKFNLDDLRSPKLLEASAFVTRGLTVSEGAGRTARRYTLRRNERGNYVFTYPRDYGPAALEGETISLQGEPPRQSPGVRGLLQTIDSLEAEGFEPFGAHPLSWYGLTDDSRGLRIRVTNSRPGAPGKKPELDEQTLLIGNKVPGKKGSKNGAYYARLASERAVVRVPAKGVTTVRDTLERDGEILRSLKLTQILPTSADAIDLHNPDGLTQLRRGRDMHWKVYHPSLGEARRADDVQVQGLLSALNASQQIRKFIDRGSDAEMGLTKPKTSVEIWVDAVGAESKPAPKKGKKPAKDKGTGLPPLKKGAEPAVRLFFGDALDNNTLVYVKRVADGQTNRVKVPVALRNRVNEGPLSYLDRNLTGFTAKDVTGVVRTKGAETYEITREPKGTKWRLVRPKTSQKFADTGDASLLAGALTRLHIVRWVKVLDTKPSRGNLREFGLDDPAMKLEVTFKDPVTEKKETRTYEFGKQVQYDKDGNIIPGGQAKGDKNPQPGVFGRVGRDIFLARAREYREIADAELRDRTVFQFSASAVTGLRLSGWHDPTKKDFLVDFYMVREKEEWEVKEAPKGFDADPTKVYPLLGVLSNLRLTRFVKPDPKEDYGLGKQKGGRQDATLIFRITVRGRKEPYTLTLGKPQSKEFYYAQSDTLGSAVFLLPASQFAMLLKDKGSWIDYFQKKAK